MRSWDQTPVHDQENAAPSLRRHRGTNRAFTATNTGSERALRPSAGFRTIPHGFRPGGAKRDAEIRSVIATARRRARTTREAIRHTLAGKPLATAP
jgi:hypothetical protein